MVRHSETRLLPHTQEQLFELVSSIEEYPEFLPWCIDLVVKNRSGNIIDADMTVGFKMLREKFSSQVTLTPKKQIDVEYIDGPFRYLQNRWRFIPNDGGCEVCFFIDFEFRSRFLKLIMEPLFFEAVRRMVSAFEIRAAERFS
ncbi:MAG: type II toxin-antitoxin system RatA family toxin [Pseudomonadota bacterium]|nr:type II toxin-antitoxin system RatA family toxin [Pseudomonadota bacterium]